MVMAWAQMQLKSDGTPQVQVVSYLGDEQVKKGETDMLFRVLSEDGTGTYLVRINDRLRNAKGVNACIKSCSCSLFQKKAFAQNGWFCKHAAVVLLLHNRDTVTMCFDAVDSHFNVWFRQIFIDKEDIRDEFSGHSDDQQDDSSFQSVPPSGVVVLHPAEINTSGAANAKGRAAIANWQELRKEVRFEQPAENCCFPQAGSAGSGPGLLATLKAKMSVARGLDWSGGAGRATSNPPESAVGCFGRRRWSRAQRC